MPVKIIIVTALALSSLTTLIFSVYGALRLKKPGTKAYVLLMIAISLYSIGYAIGLSSSVMERILLGIKIEYLGIVFIPVFWIMFAFQYSGIEFYRKRILYPILILIPLITLSLVMTCEFHDFYYKSLVIKETRYFAIAVVEKGTWYYVHLIYNIMVIFIGNALFFRLILRTSGFLRKQAIIIFIASLLPWIGDTLYLTGYSLYGLDYTPFFLTLMGPLLLFALFRYKMFDLTPIARSIVFNKMKNPVFVLDNKNRLVDLNHAAGNFLTPAQRTPIGLQTELLFSDLGDFYRELLFNDGSAVEFQKSHADGMRYYSSDITPIFSRTGAEIGNILSIQDITTEKNMIKRLHTLATVDELTGIYNRRNFMNLCTVELEKARRYGKPLSILILDIDFFKEVNDKYGHQAGDKALQVLAQSLHTNLRYGDFAARYGGEEFVIALPETGLERVQIIADRLNKSAASLRIIWNDETISLTVSIGTFTIDKEYSHSTIDHALFNADKALYSAKKQGRNRAVIFAPERENLLGK